MRAVCLLLLALTACSYQSRYVAPLDGRPRVVWTGSDVAADFAGAGLSHQCAAVIAAAIDGAILSAGIAATSDDDSHVRDRLVQRSIIFRSPDAVGASGGIYIGGAFSSGGGSSGSGGGDKAAAIMAVIAILILGPADMYLSFAPPESASNASEVIDLVNGYNEAVRLEVPGCAVPRVRAPAQGPELKGL